MNEVRVHLRPNGTCYNVSTYIAMYIAYSKPLWYLRMLTLMYSTWIRNVYVWTDVEHTYCSLMCKCVYFKLDDDGGNS